MLLRDIGKSAGQIGARDAWFRVWWHNWRRGQAFTDFEIFLGQLRISLRWVDKGKP